jgi:hypothetical protein
VSFAPVQSKLLRRLPHGLANSQQHHLLPTSLVKLASLPLAKPPCRPGCPSVRLDWCVLARDLQAEMLPPDHALRADRSELGSRPRALGLQAGCLQAELGLCRAYLERWLSSRSGSYHCNSRRTLRGGEIMELELRRTGTVYLGRDFSCCLCR